MNRHIINKLDKVLALADSDQEGEAVGALRKARELMLQDGLSFGDLARAAAQKPRASFSLGRLSSLPFDLEADLKQLRRRLDDLQTEMRTQEIELGHLRNHNGELAQKLAVAQDEASRWRQLARDTVEKLWDLSLAVQQDDEATGARKPKKAQ